MKDYIFGGYSFIFFCSQVPEGFECHLSQKEYEGFGPTVCVWKIRPKKDWRYFDWLFQ